MRTDDSGPISIFRVEPSDERQVVFQELQRRYGQKEGAIIVLPNEAVKAFQSPKDFHDLMTVKRQWDLQIAFVIPKQGQAQWAKSNNFTVYPSWEALVKATSSKRNRTVLTRQVSVAASMPVADMYPIPPTPLSRIHSLQEEQPSAQFPSNEDNQPPYGYNPITPTPAISQEFLNQAASRLSSQSLRTEQESQPSGVFQQDPTPNLVTTSPPQKRKRQRPRQALLYIVLTIVLLSAVLSAGLLLSQKGGIPSTNSRTNVTGGTLSGHIYFQSSGQINGLGTTGINDITELALSHLTPPRSGKSYYVWLRSDVNRSDGPVLLLGQLQVSQGKAQLTYRDPQHSNLLATMSQFLITEEDATTQPTVPSPDHSTWRYTGLIPQTPNPTDTQDHFSYLDHLRHLLAADPTLEKLGLHGGLSFWLYKNTQKVSEWASAAQDEPNPDLVHRHMLRILDYLDGTGDVARDVPAGSPILVDQTQGRVGILQIHANQNPEGYLQHIGFHLNSLISSPGTSADQQHIAAQLVVAMDNVNTWLGKARQDAQQLVVLSNKQLLQPPAKALLNDLATQVNDAYVGTTDPTTGSMQQGVDWIHTTMQNMAAININTYQA